VVNARTARALMAGSLSASNEQRATESSWNGYGVPGANDVVIAVAFFGPPSGWRHGSGWHEQHVKGH
jgi:hypothetical protein